MTALTSYSTGTVSVADGGTVVTGAGVIWNDGSAKPGDILQIGNFQSLISDVGAGAELTIPPWGGGAQAGAAYKIWHVSPQRFAGAEAMSTVSKLVTALSAREIPVVVGDDETVPDPSLGEEDQTAIQPSTGKVWVMSGGVWTFLGIYRGFNLTGAYNGVTTYSVGDVQTTAGTSYVWINPTPGAGHPAPDPTYWQIVASKGDTGATGATGAGYGGTSTTSLTIGTGPKPFTTQAGLAYQDGARVRATATAGAAGWLEGVVTYSGTALTITSDKASGSGTGTAWNFNVVGEAGAGDVSSANNGTEYNAATFAANLGLVRYGAAQSLTAPQKSQARTNIGMSDGHLPGIASNTAASSGEVGEVISASGTSGSLSSGVTANLGSISLTAGDWDISAQVQFNTGGGTTSTDYVVSISATSASVAAPYGTSLAIHERVPSMADHGAGFTIPPTQALVNATTSFYLNAQAVYSGTAVTATWSIRARRMR
ncbi:hypothetical protein [Bradyrhizobium sp. UNPA324]|uniref:hypothetical protein n=1 Tax=Bradyrhizobium sp. UNPA324 TaxID=1141174 RepID=UPI00114D9D84|nr:hypothetical protein [Bradyrhizobium sp. UNPA324]TQF31714.1 hypothetical protein UNPA324_20355 [Bradyrhizobium sp. UNPA324]